jgi:hypothetical protein
VVFATGAFGQTAGGMKVTAFPEFGKNGAEATTSLSFKLAPDGQQVAEK